MRKTVLIIAICLIFIFCFFIGIYLSKIISMDDEIGKKIAENKKIYDECTLEYENLQKIESANAKAKKDAIDEKDDECYIVKDLDGYVAVYALDANEEEKLINVTEIATNFLTLSDIERLRSGEKLYGKENLNKLLEDLE